jgi:mannose-6-phosphate isomerase
MDVPALSALPSYTDWVRTRATWRAWFLEEAFPLWSTRGVDRVQGGFFEKLDAHGVPVAEPRRTRVAARQLYVMSVAPRLGWPASTTGLMRHGLDFLLTQLRGPDGTFAASFDVQSGQRHDTFDLYEQAFALFALASVHQTDRTAFADLPGIALDTLKRLRAGWQHPLGGFHESAPPQAPLRSNPHMHLLEAALQWHQACQGDTPEWAELADEVVALALDHLLHQPSGLVTEWFDLDWSPMPGVLGTEAEPGHQFEWGWLLMRWALARPAHARRTKALAAARRMIDLGERLGVDAQRGVAINVLDTDGCWRDPCAKLWPQTERVKAWVARAELAENAADAAWALNKATEAARTLQRYLDHPIRGAWQESLDAQNRWQSQDTRASSLYHIVYALETACGLRD